MIYARRGAILCLTDYNGTAARRPRQTETDQPHFAGEDGKPGLCGGRTDRHRAPNGGGNHNLVCGL